MFTYKTWARNNVALHSVKLRLSVQYLYRYNGLAFYINYFTCKLVILIH